MRKHLLPRVAAILHRLVGVAIFSTLGLVLIVPAVRAVVTVDQTPLTAQAPVSPNIVLMLDDSGSMAWNFMPDLCFLQGVSCSSGTLSQQPNNSALINAANNGVYYNPTVTYTPPPQVNGASYANSPAFTRAWADGFRQSASVDISDYANSNRYAYLPSNVVVYPAVYDAFSNGAGLGLGYSNIALSTVNTSKTQTITITTTTEDQCQTAYQNDPASAGAGYTYSNGTCSWLDYFHYFQFSTGPASGPYTVYYVAPATQGCGTQTNCFLETDTSGAAAPPGIPAGLNIANWFSYYRTRILAAKSGLMAAFNTLPASVRLGFSSIDGNNLSFITSLKFWQKNSFYIADVEPFDQNCVASPTSPCAPGQAGTQRANFWSWVIGENASGGTPLRLALDTVGQYYQSTQPWQNSDTDPTALACRQAYTILTTDGFWNENASSWGNVDGSAGPKIVGPNGQSYQYSPVGPYSDSYSDTLADVAMKYWEQDLQPSIPNEVPPSAEDPAFWQHMATFTLGLGFDPVGISPSGTTIPQIFNWADGGTPIGGFSWPQPGANSIYNIADLAHAAVNGHGGFFSAKSPQAFASGIQDAIKRVVERAGSGASLAANSTKLDVGTVTYQALYFTGKWKGDLYAYSVNPNTGAIATAPTWIASKMLPSWSNRNIWTYNPSGRSATQQFVTFSSPSSLSIAEQNALGPDATTQQTIINYLRGDSSNEQKNNGTLRNRDTPLGDIVDSQPVYEGAPDPNLYYGKSFSGSDSYQTFAANYATRSPVIWVAANDGMLHAYDAGTGAEVFAYVPAAVITSGLSSLSNPSYGSSSVPHQMFNDGELTIADAWFGNGSSGGWHTVLVGTTGRGPAKAVYALDVTTPSSPVLLWERSAGDGQANSNYIGQIVGKPVIAQTANGSWSVLIGNGYNSLANTAALLQFDLQTGALSVHTTDNTTNNGLAAPVVWQADPTNAVGTTAYAGDLYGNVWSFDLSTSTSSGTKLFVARDANGAAQPITAGMLAGQDPQTGNLWLFFGTGRYLNQSDLTNLQTQTWYGIIVQPGPSQPLTLVSNLVNGRAALVQRTITAEVEPNPQANPPTLGARAISLGTNGDMNGKSGWYIDLVSPTLGVQGERMVTPNQFQGNLLIGTTKIPQASDPCNPSGVGWIMAISPFTGTNPPQVFFDVNGDGQFNSADMLSVGGQLVAAAGVGFNSIPNNPIFVGNTMLVSFDNASTGSIRTAGSVGQIGRVSWRELVTH